MALIRWLLYIIMRVCENAQAYDSWFWLLPSFMSHFWAACHFENKRGIRIKVAYALVTRRRSIGLKLSSRILFSGTESCIEYCVKCITIPTFHAKNVKLGRVGYGITHTRLRDLRNLPVWQPLQCNPTLRWRWLLSEGDPLSSVHRSECVLGLGNFLRQRVHVV